MGGGSGCLRSLIPEVMTGGFPGSGGGDDRAATVSVVIPTHNRLQLVAAAVQSVLIQPESCEVIVVDDGSSPPVVAAGPLAHGAVRIVRNSVALGPSRARNIGLDQASGDFVAFLDDDDRWLPGKLTAALAAMERHPEAGVVAHRTGFEAPAETAGLSKPSVLTEPLRHFGTHQTPHPDSLLLRTSMVGDVRFPEDMDAAEDVDFAIELARRTPFVMLDTVLAVHGPDDVPTAVGLDKRIAARRELRTRHGDVLYADARSRAFYHVRLGHLLRKRSRIEALGSFLTALRHEPANRMAWRGLVATLLPVRLAHRLSTARRAGGA